MKKNIFVFIIFFSLGLFFINNTNAATNGEDDKFILLWDEYPLNPAIDDIAVGEDHIWGAHTEGAIRWNKEDHTYRIFTKGDGLIDSYVTAVEIDNANNVWFGTPTGLSRLSGNTWTHFTTSNGLTDNNILSLSLGTNGEMLIGTENGLTIFDGLNWYQYVHNLIEDPDRCLYYGGGVSDAEIASNGHIWISTSQSATCYFDGARWWLVAHDGEGVNSDQIEFSENGDLWLAGIRHQNEQGVMRLEADGTWHHYLEADGLLDDETTSLTIDSSGVVWVGIDGFGTFDKGVSSFDGSTWTSYTFTDGYHGGGVRAIDADGSGKIWTGNINNVSLLQNDNWQAFLAGPPRGYIRDFFFDSNGHLWMSINQKGVVKFDGQTWISYTTEDGLAGNDVYDIFIDTSDNIWFACYSNDGAGQGITNFDGTNWQTITTSDGLTDNRVEDIAIDTLGDLWVAYRYGGLSKWDNSTWTHYDATTGLLYDRVSAIFVQNNFVWFSHSATSQSGISLWDGTSWTTYENELSFIKVNNFQVDGDGTLHALAHNGVNLFNGTNWSGIAIPNVNQFNPPSSDFYANDFTFDSSGNLWIVGYQDLLMYDGTNWYLYNEQNTPVSRLIQELTIDSSGTQIWIDSSDGIVQFEMMEVASQVFLPIIQK